MTSKREPIENHKLIISEDDFIPFREWYDSLDNSDKRKFRDELIRVSGMQFPTFYSKLRRNFFSPLEIKAMSEIIYSLMAKKIHFPPVIEFIKGEIKIYYKANHNSSDLLP